MAKNINFFDQASSETVPVIGNIAASDLVKYASDAAFEAANLGAPITGNIYYNTTDDVIRYYKGAWKTLEDEDITAGDVAYSNGTSGLTATDTQAAIDEVEGRVDTAETNITTNAGDIDDLETLSGVPGATDLGTFTGSTIADNTTVKPALQSLETEVELKIDSSEKGANNGVATLDGSGKVPSSQISIEFMSLEGNWNASTNTPTLANTDTGQDGVVYKCSVAGTTDFGAGNITFDAGDWVYNDGSVWEKADNVDNVTSVNSQQGAVVLDADDISDAATTNKFATAAELSAIATNSAKVSADGSIDTHSDVDTSTVAPTDGQALVWNNGDSEWQPGNVAASGGGGGINHILNPDFEIDTTGWTAYADAAADTPVDGTGGSATSVFERTTNAAEILRGTASGEFRKPNASNEQGEGFSYDFSIDAVDAFKKLNVSFDYKTDQGASYTNGDFRVFIYDVTNATLLGAVSNDDDGDIIASSGGTFNGTFYATDSLSYRFIVHVTTTDTAGKQLNIDTVTVSPDAFAPGAIITEWESFTPTGTWTTNTTYSGYKRRVGDTMELDIEVNLSGAPNAASLTIDVPDSLTIDVAKISDDGDNRFFGNAALRDSSASASYIAAVSYSSTTAVGASRIFDSGTLERLGGIDQTNPFTWASGDKVFMKYTIPIQEWAASNLVSTTETLFMSAKARVYYTSDPGQTIATTATTQLNFDTTQYDDFGMWDNTSKHFVIPRDGTYLVTHNIRVNGIGDNLFGNVSIRINASVFENSKVSGQSGTSLDTISGNAIIQVSKGDTVDLQINSNDSSYSVAGAVDRSSFTIHEMPDFSTFGVYNETETVEVQAQPFTFPAWAANTWLDITSFDLPAGEWDVEVICAHKVALVLPGAIGGMNVHIHTVAGNNSGTLLYGDNASNIPFPNSTQQPINSVFKGKITVASNTTYYLKQRCSLTPPASSIRLEYYKVFARKVK